MKARLWTRAGRWVVDIPAGTYETQFSAKTPAHRVHAALERDFPSWEILEPADSLRLWEETEAPAREESAPLFAQ